MAQEWTDGKIIYPKEADTLCEQLEFLDHEINNIKMAKRKLESVHCGLGKHSDNIVEYCKRTDKVFLDVIAVVSNPVEYKTRYKLFQEFCTRIRREPQIRLFTVELQHGNKPFITNANLKYRSNVEVWHKENLINNAVHHLPRDWEYMAWIDADIEFQNKNWVAETIRQLQHYDIVQLFSHAIDMGPSGEIVKVHTGFCYQWENGKIDERGPYKEFWHTGYGFAMRRRTFDALGGLLEFPILGAADHHMCKAWIGRVHESFPKDIHPNYKRLCEIYQERCERHLHRNLGYVSGTIMHYWHGKKADRKYLERWNILVSHKFDPLVDIKKDSSNLWILEGNKPGLMHDLKKYFRARNEDSVDC